MLRRTVLLVLLAACMFALPLRSAAAQVGEASLMGQVVDETGAAVPGALITVRRSSTASERRIESDSEGTFFVSELAAGDYEITATSAGFAVAVQRVSLRPGEAPSRSTSTARWRPDRRRRRRRWQRSRAVTSGCVVCPDPWTSSIAKRSRRAT